jgi:hypothetical protein
MSVNYQEMTTDQLRDLLDAKPVHMPADFDDDRQITYYEDMEKYYQVLYDVGYNAQDAFEHELSHGRCALAVGMVSVKYGVEFTSHASKFGGLSVPKRAVTSLIGPVELPNIAYAAITAAPKNPSPGDLTNMRKAGYNSVAYLTERIERWNSLNSGQDNGLVIPIPGTIDTRWP